MNSDFKDLLRLFAKHRVRYPIVGGYAVIHCTQFVIGRAPVQIDFLTSIPPLDFAGCWKRRKTSRHEGISVHYLSLEDLKQTKAHAARQVDLADLEELDLSLNKRKTK